MTAENQVDIHFFNLVVSLSQAAMMGMGKITNPQTGKVEVTLPLAKINIDILQMLKDKTEGNLDPKEAEVLYDSLTSLQLTYAEEVKKAPAEEASPEVAESEEKASEESSDPAEKAEEKSEEKSE